MRDMVVNRIVRKTGLCSVISDGTQDESKLEARCVILRYLEDTPAGMRPVDCRATNRYIHNRRHVRSSVV
jgi:hypothetical protein